MSKVKKNYSTTECEGLAILNALKYLVNKPLLGEHICRWLLSFQEYDVYVIVKLGCLNTGPNNLSQIEIGEEPTNLEEGLPNTQIFVVHVAYRHFKDIIQFLTIGTVPKEYCIQQKKELVVHVEDFTVIVGHLYKMGNYEILRRYVPEFQ